MPCDCMVTCALRWFRVPYAFSQPCQPHLYMRSISSYRRLGRLCCCAPGIGTKEYTWLPNCLVSKASSMRRGREGRAPCCASQHLPESACRSGAQSSGSAGSDGWRASGQRCAGRIPSSRDGAEDRHVGMPACRRAAGRTAIAVRKRR